MKITNRLALLLASALCAWAPAYADTKISDLPAASALAGTEAVPAVQSGATVKTTPAAVNTYVQAQTTGAVVVSKFSGTCTASTALLGDASCGTVPLPSTVTGNHTFSGSISFQNQVGYANNAPVTLAQLTPSTLGTTVNNYDFGLFGCCSGPLYRLEAASGGSTVTGFALSAGDFYLVLIFNVSATDSITFKNQNAGSSAGNRFLTPNAADFVLRPQSGAYFWYDATGISRWRIVAP